MIQFICAETKRALTIRSLLACIVLLVSAPVSAQLTNLYTANSKQLIEEFSTNSAYRLIGTDSLWNYIRFDAPTAPVWVSTEFLSVSNGIAIVSGNKLNARLAPSLDATVLTLIAQGYTSPVLDMRGEFARILAPQNTVVAVSKSGSSAAAVEEPIVTSEPSADQNSPPELPLTREPTRETSAPAPTARQIKEATVNSGVESSTQHRIAPGDSISLVVFGEPDLSRADLAVAENGQVSFPLLGAIDIGGMTTSQVEREIQSRLATGYVRDPKVSVSMFSYRPVFIRGAVRNTGAFEFSQGLTVSKALALAGGATASAKFEGVKIERNGEVQIEGLSIDSQYAVGPGDVISVDGEFGQADSGESYIYLHGEVNQPGEYRFRSGLTVEKAVVLAGGFSLRASKRKISITRYATNQEQPEEIKRAELYMPIEPGDVIDVGASWF